MALMRTRETVVRMPDRVYRLFGVVGPDGLVVADPRGLRESRTLLRRVRRARFRQQAYRGFLPFARRRVNG